MFGAPNVKPRGSRVLRILELAAQRSLANHAVAYGFSLYAGTRV